MEVLKVFVDESCQDAHEYMVLSGVAVRGSDLEAVTSALREVQKRHCTLGTMKWEKVSKAKVHVYRDYVDAFFALCANDKIHFHCIVIKTSDLNHSRFNSGNPQVGFSKLVYQLLCKFGREYAKEYLIHCYLDHRNTKQSLEELRQIVNNGLAQRWDISTRPFRRLEFAQTESECLLQINDVLLGSISSRCNGHHRRKGASLHKSDLSRHVMQRANVSDPLRSTPLAESRFTLWKFRLQGR